MCRWMSLRQAIFSNTSAAGRQLRSTLLHEAGCRAGDTCRSRPPGHTSTVDMARYFHDSGTEASSHVAVTCTALRCIVYLRSPHAANYSLPPSAPLTEESPASDKSLPNLAILLPPSATRLLDPPRCDAPAFDKSSDVG